MAENRTSLQRFSAVTLNVLGIAWVAIHVFLVLATLYAIFFPFVLAAVPYFAGTRLLGRRAARLGTVLTLAGALLMAGVDVYATIVFPRYPDTYPAATMLQVVGRMYGHEMRPVTPAPAVRP